MSWLDIRKATEAVTSAEEVTGVAATVSMVSLASLRRGPVLRVMGEDQAHARLLAITPVPLPPILVERSTMRIIDGVHRVLAAKLRGATSIAARFFEGDEADAFVAAVRANIEHGKPLSLADREHATERLVTLHPEWSDRAIAETCGLAPKTVGRIRNRATADFPQLHTRIGRDGRSRPVDPVPGRQRVAAALIADPDAPLREIARRTRTSVGTVRAVRRSLAEEENLGRVGAEKHPDTEGTKAAVAAAAHMRWSEDTACASSEEARRFARWFDANEVREEECREYEGAVPLSRAYAVVAEASARSRAWAEFAEALERRARKEASARPVVEIAFQDG